MLAISQLSMRFGAKILFQNVSLQFHPKGRVGLVGANGSGKSTLIQILSGEVSPEKGEVVMPQRAILGVLSQDHYRYREDPILEVVLQGRKELWRALQEKGELLKKETFQDRECLHLSELEKCIEEEGGYTAEAEAAQLLEGLGVRTQWHRKPLASLSGGYKLRVLLAQVLFARPDILILDEPTNHLDLYSIKWLEEYLKNFSGTLIVTSHDRDFLNGVCTHIADVDYGTVKLYSGNYEAFIGQKQRDREQKERLLQKNEERRAELQTFIDRFGTKATKARQAQSKAKIVEQLEDEMEEIDLRPSSRIDPTIHFEPLRPSGIAVLKVAGISKAYGPKKVLDQVSFEVERGERVAIIGPNGIGKSTLLEILMAHRVADAGEFRWGHAARLAYLPQDHAGMIDPDRSLLDWLSQFDPEMPQERLRSLLGTLCFSGDLVKQRMGTLSGGETARLLLAKMMLQKPNVLIFDEPTNHLDLESIDALAKGLEAYTGTLLLVSHNRYFVSRLANRIIEISYQGVEDFQGSYGEYLEKEQCDHLNPQVSLRERHSHESQRRVVSSSSRYAEQKQKKSQQAKLKKRVAQAEERCHQLEEQMKELDEQMAEEGFYQRVAREEQQRLVALKGQLEEELLLAFEQWEEASHALAEAEGEDR